VLYVVRLYVVDRKKKCAAAHSQHKKGKCHLSGEKTHASVFVASVVPGARALIHGLSGPPVAVVPMAVPCSCELRATRYAIGWRFPH